MSTPATAAVPALCVATLLLELPAALPSDAAKWMKLDLPLFFFMATTHACRTSSLRMPPLAHRSMTSVPFDIVPLLMRSSRPSVKFEGEADRLGRVPWARRVTLGAFILGPTTCKFVGEAPRLGRVMATSSARSAPAASVASLLRPATAWTATSTSYNLRSRRMPSASAVVKPNLHVALLLPIPLTDSPRCVGGLRHDPAEPAAQGQRSHLRHSATPPAGCLAALGRALTPRPS